MSEVLNRQEMVHSITVRLSLKEAHSLMTALASATSEEDKVILTLFNQLKAAVEAHP